MVEAILDIEKHIIGKIRHRLTVSCGHCSISVRSLAKGTARDAGLMRRDGMTPREFYAVADHLLRACGGVLWMHGYGGQQRYGREMRSAIASRVYTFDPATAREAMLAHV